MTLKVQPAVDYWTVDRETWGGGCVIFGRQKNKELIFSLRVRKYFEWVLQISEGVIHLGLRPRWITATLICKILHNLRKPNSIFSNYFFFQRGHDRGKQTPEIKHDAQERSRRGRKKKIQTWIIQFLKGNPSTVFCSLPTPCISLASPGQRTVDCLTCTDLVCCFSYT